jgi:hypothetical protein
MMLCLRLSTVCFFAAWLGLGLLGARPAGAQSAISGIADKTCAVMSGEQKVDSQTLQYLMWLDEDMADANPVALALQRRVLVQCPKAYLAYHQRMRAHNPFPAGYLTKETPTQLTGGATTLTKPVAPADFPMRCIGAPGMASAAGKTLIVQFAKVNHPAAQGLRPGQCSWLDRGSNANEPARIEFVLTSPADARNGVSQINAGGTWTFWVFDAKTAFHATAVGKGAISKKP